MQTNNLNVKNLYSFYLKQAIDQDIADNFTVTASTP